MSSLREQLEDRERETLAPQAAKSADSRGRLRPEREDDVRPAFQRDRDRIIHCKAFRRLKHKTQVFFAPAGDHYRTRLTHTLEVSALARTVARALRLNEDLTEAIGLGHDLGHPPFGHAGEAALDDALQTRFQRRFRHNEHSLRVVDVLERGGRGLNLTLEVRDGILNHTGPVAPESLEGRIVKLVDRVAYINHDIDDALRAGVLDAGELPAAPVAMLGSTGSARIDAIVHDLVETSDVAGDIRQSEPVAEAMLALRTFLFERVYGRGPLRAEADRAAFVVRSLFAYFCEHPAEMDDGDPPVDAATRVTDHVAGMTDRFALRRFEELLLPLAQAGP
jgi:dGTPase